MSTAISPKSPRSKMSVKRTVRVKDKNFIGLTEKVFDVLEAFSQHPRNPISLEEITRSVGMAKTTVYRLIYSLKRIGYLEQHENGDYCLSPKFYQLGRNGLPHRHLTTLAKPVLDKLVVRTGESAHIGVLEDGLILFVAVAPSQHAYRCSAEIGECNYAHSTALGKAILANLEPDEVELVLSTRGLPKLTSLTITDKAQFALELAKVRNQGYAINNNENTEGVICIAAPILDSVGKAIAALSLSGPASRMQASMESLIQNVKQTSFRISMLLGYKSPIPNGLRVIG
jgi:IclR family KDG regulon transcriptional repressor